MSAAGAALSATEPGDGNALGRPAAPHAADFSIRDVLDDWLAVQAKVIRVKDAPPDGRPAAWPTTT